MDIITQPSIKSRIHFIRNTNHQDWYIVKKMTDMEVMEFYLKSHHLPPHENSGFQELPIEWAFALDFGNVNAEKFVSFIRYQKGIRHSDEHQRIRTWIGENGWYAFADIKNTDKWLNDFVDFNNQQYDELQKADGNGRQAALF